MSGKIQTRFPHLHMAAGASQDDLEVLPPVGDESGAETKAPPAQEEESQLTPAPAPQNPDTAAPSEDLPKNLSLTDISDEEFEKEMARRTKGKIKSLSPIEPEKPKSKEEIEAETVRRQQESLSWALENKKISREEYDASVVLRSKASRDIALEAFTASLLAEDSSLTPEDAAEIFKDTYHEGQPEDSRLYKLGQKEIEKLAESVRRDRLSAIDAIPTEYDEAVASQAQYRAFRKQVKEVGGDIPKTIDLNFSYDNVDGSPVALSHSFHVDPKLVDKIVNDIASEKSFVLRNLESDGKFDSETLSAEISKRIRAEVFDEAYPQILGNMLKQQEVAIIARLGNKRPDNGGLNNGVPLTLDGATKKNDYSSLRETMQRQKIG